ncbi:transposase family protein [Streptomyces sp. NBC_00280]|uniref:transposase family protein n=1 Tax=Streptomyces sp. NBC_00280 TaxID=2975699 RepID=UPI00352F0A15
MPAARGPLPPYPWAQEPRLHSVNDQECCGTGPRHENGLTGWVSCDVHLARAACSHPALSGVPRAHFGELLKEPAPRWQAARESALHDQRRGGDRRRAADAGPKQRLVFVDRLLVTLVHLRPGIPHAALAELYAVARSTVSGAIRPELNRSQGCWPPQQVHALRAPARSTASTR